MTDKEYTQRRLAQIEQQRAAENPEYEEQRRAQLRERRAQITERGRRKAVEHAMQKLADIEQNPMGEVPDYEESQRAPLQERRKVEAGKNSQRRTLDKPIFLTTEQLAARYYTSTNTVAIWRSKGDGPPWIKLGSRVMYRIDKVIDWENRRLQGGAPANTK